MIDVDVDVSVTLTEWSDTQTRTEIDRGSELFRLHVKFRLSF